MWGNFFAESTYLQNFTFGFPNKQSDILLHLTHWQYWFWFWFTYFLVLYYFIFLRLIRFRSQKFSPKMATTFRSHGKWGDLLVCFLPLSWCTNILSNSNFILRMIEWQSESSLFTLRIRGKQWYWVYKFELKSLMDINNASKNIGRGNYNQALHFSNNDLFFVKFKHDVMYNFLNWSGVLKGNSSKVSNNYIVNPFNAKPLPTLNLPSLRSELVNTTSFYNSNDFLSSKSSIIPLMSGNFTLTSSLGTLANLTKFSGSSSQLSPLVTRVDKVGADYKPFRLLTSRSNNLTISYFDNNFSKKKFNNNLFFVLKQKRFSYPNLKSNKGTFSSVSLDYKGLNLKNFNTYMSSNFNVTDLKSVVNNKRLLRTRRILVLPTKVNITLITNSFDVMHSWYIPGLGVKLDCVPGRSTHHTIHIDHVGFYYGQCAEICGRYHHHMPIRVCALPFNHFMLWWFSYGAPFFLQRNGERSNQVVNSTQYFNW